MFGAVGEPYRAGKRRRAAAASGASDGASRGGQQSVVAELARADSSRVCLARPAAADRQLGAAQDILTRGSVQFSTQMQRLTVQFNQEVVLIHRDMQNELSSAQQQILDVRQEFVSRDDRRLFERNVPSRTRKASVQLPSVAGGGASALPLAAQRDESDEAESLGDTVRASVASCLSSALDVNAPSSRDPVLRREGERPAAAATHRTAAVGGDWRSAVGGGQQRRQGMQHYTSAQPSNADAAPSTRGSRMVAAAAQGLGMQQGQQHRTLHFSRRTMRCYRFCKHKQVS